MATVVSVSFRPVTKVYYFDPAAFIDLQVGEYVVVETSQGREVGQVVRALMDVPDDSLDSQLKPVVRRATAWDMVQRDLYQRREAEVLAVCRAKAAEHGLPMEVVSAEYSFDGGRLVISFTAEGRIDFRELVRDMARAFSARIEMKQIGVRDQAKVLDGIGKCGCRLCCSAWLREFAPVTIKMAKQQNLPLNPAEISGVCGRLLCCLSYEMEAYSEARSHLPKVGATVETPVGLGRVRKVHPLQETVTVRLEDETLRDFALDELKRTTPPVSGRSCSGCAMQQSSLANPPALRPLAAPPPPPPVDEHPAEDEAKAAAARRHGSRRRRRKSHHE